LVLKRAAASQFSNEAEAFASRVQVFESDTMVGRYFARMFAPAVSPTRSVIPGSARTPASSRSTQH
jgi:hypothetical protein